MVDGFESLNSQLSTFNLFGRDLHSLPNRQIGTFDPVMRDIRELRVHILPTGSGPQVRPQGALLAVPALSILNSLFPTPCNYRYYRLPSGLGTLLAPWSMWQLGLMPS